jgi:hypothetical protein
LRWLVHLDAQLGQHLLLVVIRRKAVEKHLYALPQDHGKLVIKILEIRPRGPVHRGRFLVAVPADFTAIPPGDTVEPAGRPHRQRVT